MAQTIVSNEAAANELAMSIKTQLGEYLGFRLHDLSWAVPVNAGSRHDGLSPEITKALNAWENLIDADAKAIVDAAGEFAAFDNALAAQLMGAGGII